MYFASGENKFNSFNDCIRKVANVNRDGEMNKKKKKKKKKKEKKKKKKKKKKKRNIFEPTNLAL